MTELSTRPSAQSVPVVRCVQNRSEPSVLHGSGKRETGSPVGQLFIRAAWVKLVHSHSKSVDRAEAVGFRHTPAKDGSESPFTRGYSGGWQRQPWLHPSAGSAALCKATSTSLQKRGAAWCLSAPGSPQPVPWLPPRMADGRSARPLSRRRSHCRRDCPHSCRVAEFPGL